MPDELSDGQVIFLWDILPTGHYAADIADVQPGDDVAVFGAGPVGYFVVLSAFLRGAAKVMSIDNIADSLELTAALGATPINFDEQDPVEAIREHIRGRGAICIDAVGYEAIGHQQATHKQKPAHERENPTQVLEWIGRPARKFSIAGIPGVYAGACDNFPFGLFFTREIQIRTGQCPVKRYTASSGRDQGR